MRKPRANSVGRDIRTIRAALASIARAVQRLAPLPQAAAANAGPRPFRQGDDQRVLRQLLGQVDISHHAGEARDEPRPFNAKGRFYCSISFRLVRLARGHTAF